MDIDTEKLRATSGILHLLYHRNRNQHRHCNWWRWLSMLKRCVGKLVLELEETAQGRAEARVVFISQRLLPKCYLSFTQLIQDNQFSAIGLVLMAEISRIREAIGSSIIHAEAPGSSGVEIVVNADESTTAPSEDLGVAVARTSRPSLRSPGLNLDLMSRPQLSFAQQSAKDKDYVLLGENVVGAIDGDIHLVTRDPTALGEMELQTTVASMKKSRKRRRAANPIDELFEGLE